MFRKELLILGAISSLLFLVVAGGASLAVRALQADAAMVAEDTLPGLVSAGEAIDQINRNWLNSHQLLHVSDAGQRAQIMRRIETNSTGPLWEAYSQSIRDPEDAQLFADVGRTRLEFLTLRTNYFALIQAQRTEEAARFFEDQLSPAFERYRRAASEAFRFNARMGKNRAENILHYAGWTPYVMGGLAVAILLAGVVIGFKASLGAFMPAQEDELLKQP